MVANPIESDKQLALTMYRMAHGRSTKRFKDIFGVSQALVKYLIMLFE